jgi:trimeric autotransporter adhesin
LSLALENAMRRTISRSLLLLASLSVASWTVACSDSDGANTTPDATTDTGDTTDGGDGDVNSDAGPDASPDADDASADVTPDADVDQGDTSDADAGDDATDGSTEPPDDLSDDNLDPLTGFWVDSYGTAGVQGDFDTRVLVTFFDSAGDLYVGGSFARVNGTDVSNLAVRRGGEWLGLGDGPGIMVADLMELDGNIIAVGEAAGGGFGIGGANQVMSWDGETWTALGQTLPQFTRVNDIEVIDGEVVIVGNFAAEEGELPTWTATGAAVWNSETETWDPFLDSLDGELRTIVDTEAGFCVGGFFSTIDSTAVSNIACLEGDEWNAMAGGLNSTVNDIEVLPDGDMLVGGTFNLGDGESAFSIGIVRWNGTAFEGFFDGVGGGLVTEVRDILLSAAGGVYVGGSFDGAGSGDGTAFSTNIAYHDGTDWQTLAGGVQNRVGITISPGVYSMAQDSTGNLVAVGDFSQAGDTAASNLAMWDGEVWDNLQDEGKVSNGVVGTVRAFAADNAGTVFIGGDFTGSSASGLTNVAALRGSTLSPLEDGLPGGVLALEVDADGTLFAGGGFTDAGITGASFIAEYNGETWRALAEQLDGTVADLTFCPDGSLVAIGDFMETENGTVLNHIGVYDGTVWSALGDGLSGSNPEFSYSYSAVECLPDGSIVAGGSFDRADGTDVTSIAQYSAGSGWAALGNFDATVSVLTWYDGTLYAGGTFRNVDENPITGIAAWDGTEWTGLGAGVQTQFEFSPAHVTGISVKENGVFAAGYMERSGETAFSHVAWFDGTEWHDLGGGVNDIAEDCIVNDHSLYVGGVFTLAGGIPSLGLAEWFYGEETTEE